MLGALTTGEASGFDVGALAACGLLAHVCGFTLNELMDREVDRQGALPSKPLLTGEVTTVQAWAVVVVSLVLAIGVAVVLYGSGWTLTALLLATVAGFVYNVKGKRFPGSDLFLGGWAFLFTLFGGFAAAGGVHPSELPMPTMVIAALAGLQVFFNNAVEGGLKDARTDEASNVRSLALAMGVRVRPMEDAGCGRALAGDSGSPPSPPALVARVPLGFWTLAWGTKALSVGIAWYALAVFGAGPVWMGLATICTMAIAVTQWLFLSDGPFVREDRKRLFTVHEVAAYFLALTSVVTVIGTWPVVALAALPALLFFATNRVLYRSLLPPV